MHWILVFGWWSATGEWDVAAYTSYEACQVAAARLEAKGGELDAWAACELEGLETEG